MTEKDARRAIERVLFTKDEIAAKVRELASRIDVDYRGKDLVAVCVLNGAMIFFADLIRAMSVPAEVDSVCASSYGKGTRSCGTVTFGKDVGTDIRGRHVLLVEDIIDSGLTMAALTEELKKREPASVRVCALLDKPSRRVNGFTADYTGFEIPDEFVVGYGLDLGGTYRRTDCTRWEVPSGTHCSGGRKKPPTSTFARICRPKSWRKCCPTGA